MKSWANHIRGATAIAQIRGREQLQTDIGRAMFAHLRTQIVRITYQSKTPRFNIFIVD